MSARLAPSDDDDDDDDALFQASAFAFRSFPLLLRPPLAFAPSSNKRHHHHFFIFSLGTVPCRNNGFP